MSRLIRSAAKKLLVVTLLFVPGLFEGKAADATSNLKQVAFLGDSITCGVGVKKMKESRYSTVATRLLRAKHPDVSELNLGVSANALCQKPDNYYKGILRKNPSAVVIQWGVNDQYWGYSTAEFLKKYEVLVSGLRKARPKMPIITTTLIADFRYPENFDQWIARANVGIQAIAVRYECKVAYTHEALGHSRKYYKDTIHPNEAGAELMAKSIVAAFSEPAQDPAKFDLKFDTVSEARIQRYAFIPEWSKADDTMISIKDVTRSGLTIEANVPVLVRTPPLYTRNIAYKITMKDRMGKVISTQKVKSDWAGALRFKVTPVKGHDALSVSIDKI